MITVSVGFSSAELQAKAENLAQSLALSLNNQADCCLWVAECGIGIKFKNSKPIYADFLWDNWKKRHNEGKKQGLVRAVKPHLGMHILDVTAGWGRDAAILASFGAEVCMIERNPIMAILLQDALERQDEVSKQHLKLKLYQGNAIELLDGLKERPDLIYIDPMHPTRQKSALVKKEMQILQNVIGEDKDAKHLIDLARKYAKQKVVVKWPQKLMPLVATESFIPGTTIRFDIYPCYSAP